MKTNIDHLPPEKQAELQAIMQSISKRLPAEMIILFGSYARGNWVEDRYQENGTTYEYISDYDILVVLDTEKQAIRKESEKRWEKNVSRDVGKETPLSAIFHGIDYLNTQIEEGNYFFVDILKEGVMLFDSGNFQLSSPKLLSLKERKNKAQSYLDQWFNNAEELYDLFSVAFNKTYFANAAFLLHQATERLFMCFLLVYTDYKPKLHDLEKLDKLARELDSRFKDIFPRSTSEEARLFILLKKAYIDSRYKMNYHISCEDLEYLSLRVQKLRELTEFACKKKIESFG